MRFTDCGRITRPRVCRRFSPSALAPSHCPVGSDRMAPRTISDVLAMTGRAKPRIALAQSGNGMRRPKARISNGIRNMHRNRSTSHGELRKSCVTMRAHTRTIPNRDSWAMPTGSPAAVPTAMARIEIRMLKAKPHSSSGIQRTSTSSAVALVAAGCWASAMVAPAATMRMKSSAIRAIAGRPPFSSGAAGATTGAAMGTTTSP